MIMFCDDPDQERTTQQQQKLQRLKDRCRRETRTFNQAGVAAAIACAAVIIPDPVTKAACAAAVLHYGASYVIMQAACDRARRYESEVGFG